MPEPARILFTIPNFITAGSGRALLNIAERLDRTKYVPSICVLKRGGRLEDDFERKNIPVFEGRFCVDARPYGSLVQRVASAAKQFREGRFDIWHSFHYSDDYTEPLIARFARARAWIFTKKNMGWGSRAWRLRSLLATRILAQNSDMLELFFRSRRARKNVRYVPRGVDTARFQPAIRRNESSPLRVVATANLVPVKGVETLIRAAADVDAVEVVVAGQRLDARYCDSLDAMVADLRLDGRFRFEGEVHEIPEFLHAGDIFVLPTLDQGRREGCPVSLLEAMASGLPCIATDVPGSRDIIEHERSGLLVAPGDPEALAAQLRRLVAEPETRARLGASARDRILERYTIEREVKDHEAVYEEILA